MNRLSILAHRGLAAFFGHVPAERSLAARYAMALSLTLVAMIARLLLAPAESGGRFVTFSLAATIVAIYGGFWPAMLCTLLSMVIVSYALIPPYLQFAFDSLSEGLLLNLTFLANQLLVSAVIALMRRYQFVQTQRLQLQVDDAESRARAEQYLYNTFEHASVGIGHASPTGQWLRVNRQLCDMLGYTREELMALDYQRVTHPDHLSASVDLAQSLLDGSAAQVAVEKRYLRKDGSSVWVTLNTALVRQPDGAPDYFIAIITDISGRKASEARIREQDRQLSVISDHIPGGIALLDRDLRYRYVSREYGRFFKRSTADIVGMTMLELLGPKAFENARPHAQRALWGEASRYENHLVSADGEEIYIDVTSVPERTDSGKVKGIINVINFITDYKKTELALRETQTLLLQAQALAHITTWVFDPATQTFESLGNSRETTSLNAPRATAQDILNQVHPADRDIALKTWTSALRGTSRSYSHVYRTLVNDEVVWVSAMADIERDRLGRAVRAYGLTQNITAAKQSETALRESRELLINAQAIANIDCWIFDQEQRVFKSVNLAGNENGAIRYWRSFEEITQSVHPQDRDWVAAAWARAEAGSAPYDVVYRVVARGRTRWFHAQAHFSFDDDGNATGAIGVSQDITAQKEIELTLQEKTTQLLQAQSLARLTNWVYDVATQSYRFDENALDILGFPQLSMSAEEALKSVHVEDAKALLNSWIVALRGHDSTYRFEFRAIVRGQSVSLVSRGSIVRDDQGRALRAIGIMQDITEIKRVEQQIQQLNVELEQRVQQRTTALMVANEELESFAYAVAHDLRSPLRAINGYTQALLDEAGSRIDAPMREHFDKITRASRKMGSLIDGLLELSRHSRKPIAPLDIDLSEMARRILGDLAHADAERQVQVSIEPGIRVHADPSLLDSLMHNLLENAWKYTARTPQAGIRVYTTLADGERRIVVSDNGAGFDMNYARDLFKPFHRLHRDTEFPGVGIGLATAQRIVQRHGGTIQARSAPGQGAEFSFSLATTDAAQAV
jgi:PAS domain S-box-containing protein